MVDVIELHQEQSQPDSCLAACVCMIRSRQGRPVKEGELLAAWRHPPYSLSHSAAGELGVHATWFDPDAPSTYAALRAHLARTWIIVQMWCSYLADIADVRSIPLRSRHGRLPRRGFHSLVLIDADETGFTCLDPWYPRELQPIRLAVEDFARAWDGTLVIPAI